MVRSGQTWTGMMATRDATGALAAAGVGPVGALYVNGVLNAAVVAIAGANPYSWTVVLPVLAPGDCVSMYITATIAGVATGAVVCEDVADTMFVSDIDLCDVWDCAIAAHVGAGSTGATLNNVCTCAINGLLQHASIAAALRTQDLTLYRGDTWRQVITGMGDLTGFADIWFGIKADPDDTDNEALVLISQTVGLERINGAAAAVPANGSITVVGAPTAGVIQVDLDEVETAKLVPDKRFWDAQKLVAGVVTTPRAGRITISADIVRATT